MSGALGLAAAGGIAALAGWGIKKGVDLVSNLIKSRKSKKARMSNNTPSNSQPEIIPSQEDLPFAMENSSTSSPPSAPIYISKEEKRPPLVPVKGNPKVMRCLNCKTFVSVHDDHKYSDCNNRLAKKANNQGTRSIPLRRHKGVDKSLVKSFRKLEKENAKTSQLKSTISKKAETLIKKYKKQTKKSSKIPKQLLSFLEFVTKKVQ